VKGGEVGNGCGGSPQAASTSSPAAARNRGMRRVLGDTRTW
jgi:hypothetical protein